VVTIRWLSAALLIVLIASEFRAASTVDAVAKAAMLRAHVPIAIAVLVLTIMRVNLVGLRSKTPRGSRPAAAAAMLLRCRQRTIRQRTPRSLG
jgi:cytochrome b561